MTEEDLANAMQKYLPEGSALDIAHIVLRYNIVFKVVRPRQRYLGTCYKNKNIITVNGNLPPYLFLLVTLHELGHFISLKKYGLDIKPHGQEWKQEYTKLLKHFLYKGIFPVRLAEKVMQEIIKPQATCSKELMNECALYT
ncbi:MAG: hypothetical protein Q4Q06_05160 [Bacteroidota bacterium]|nr:hypothetical protein [Bacteroidota bacterium]